MYPHGGIEHRSVFNEDIKTRGGGQTNFCDDKNLVETDLPLLAPNVPPWGNRTPEHIYL